MVVPYQLSIRDNIINRGTSTKTGGCELRLDCQDPEYREQALVTNPISIPKASQVGISVKLPLHEHLYELE